MSPSRSSLRKWKERGKEEEEDGPPPPPPPRLSLLLALRIGRRGHSGKKRRRRRRPGMSPGRPTSTYSPSLSLSPLLISTPDPLLQTARTARKDPEYPPSCPQTKPSSHSRLQVSPNSKHTSSSLGFWELARFDKSLGKGVPCKRLLFVARTKQFSHRSRSNSSCFGIFVFTCS